ncbi:hypothetical protein ACFLYF_02930 [Chloroflexota bacterium]
MTPVAVCDFRLMPVGLIDGNRPRLDVDSLPPHHGDMKLKLATLHSEPIGGSMRANFTPFPRIIVATGERSYREIGINTS